MVSELLVGQDHRWSPTASRTVDPAIASPAILRAIAGILQVDGYTAYTKLGTDRGANDAVTIAGCWTHARRKFFDLQTSGGSPLASAILTAVAPLWAIEDDIRGQSAQGSRFCTLIGIGTPCLSTRSNLFRQTEPR
jgi:hypothetical protein